FGVPAWLGSFIMMIAVMITLTLGFSKILSALGFVTPFLIVVVAIIAVYSFFTPTVSFSEINEIADLSKTPTGIWWLEAITYSGIVIAMRFCILSFVCSQSTHTVDILCGMYGGSILLVLMLLMNAGLLSKFDKTNQADLRSLMLAYEIHRLLHFVLTV